MPVLRYILLAAAASVLLGAALAQNGASGGPQNVDDVIAKILKSTPDAETAAETPAPAAVGAPAREPVVMGARLGEHPDRTRFVVELSDPVEMRTFTLNNPNRVVIDMPEIRWHLEGPPRPSMRGAVKSYRYGMFRPGTARFVLDLNKPVLVSDILVLPPEHGFGYRAVIDLFPTTQAKFDNGSGWPQDLRARDRAAEMAYAPPKQTGPRTSKKKVVVVDPGHGGVDSGTVGADGTLEKDIVLTAALQLRKTLQARNYTVYMTRETDVFIPLPERVNFSRAHHADLFISLHADSHRDKAVSGLSIYTLSEKGSDREAAALAAKENQSDVIAGVDLAGENSLVAPILIDLVQRDTMNKSSHFAESAISELSRATDILPRRPHRSAAFVVLKAPDVPAVLIELGYLSNTSDASQMKLNAWRARVSSAIATAVDRQFTTQAAFDPAAARSVQ